MVLRQKLVGLAARKVGAIHLLPTTARTIGGCSVRSFTERQLLLIATEDLLDWRENQNRSAGDIRITDLTFTTLALLLSGLLIALISCGLNWLHA